MGYSAFVNSDNFGYIFNHKNSVNFVILLVVSAEEYFTSKHYQVLTTNETNSEAVKFYQATHH